MDFRDTPEEAAFRDEARTWLEANAEHVPTRGLGEDAAAVAEEKAWQARKAEGGWAVICPALAGW